MNGPIKTYEIINLNTFRAKHFEIRQNNQPILWINTRSGFLTLPQVNIQAQSANGPILAAAKLKSMSSGCRVIVGNPDATSKEQWNDVTSESFGGKCFGFSYGGRRLMWKRTHNKALGSSSWNSRNFKLVDATAGDKVLAVYIRASGWSAPQSGRIDFFVELGQELELMGMAAILGIEERIQRNNSTAGGADAGAAAC